MAISQKNLSRALAKIGGKPGAALAIAKATRVAATKIPLAQLINHLVKTKVAVWGVAPDGRTEILVERLGGAQLLDFQGKLISRPRSPSPTAGREFRTSYFGELGALEGLFQDMYLDTKSNVTVGMGHLITSPVEAKLLPFVKRGSSKSASDDEVQEAFDKVKRKIDWRGFAYKYVGLTAIELPRPVVTTFAFQDIDEALHQIGHSFPNFASYPLRAKHGLMDMVFNAGIIGVTRDFPVFSAAVGNRDWKTAAAESNRTTAAAVRNRTIRGWLLEALKEEPVFVNPGVKKRLTPRVK